MNIKSNNIDIIIIYTFNISTNFYSVLFEIFQFLIIKDTVETLYNQDIIRLSVCLSFFWS